MNSVQPEILLADTITKLPSNAFGAVLVSASHGGRYPGYLAAKAGVRAVILHDAGIGRDDAGIGSLNYLETLGIAAATVSYLSCVIGDAATMLKSGKISRANLLAEALGVYEGCTCELSAVLLKAARHARTNPLPLGEARREFIVSGSRRRIWLVDSASLVVPEDAGQIVVTGSHGGLIAGNPSRALNADAHTAVFNDAHRPDGPGCARLPVLEARGIAAVTVSSLSARIGDADSTLEGGRISSANRIAAARGARMGNFLKPWIIGEARRDCGG